MSMLTPDFTKRATSSDILTTDWLVGIQVNRKELFAKEFTLLPTEKQALPKCKNCNEHWTITEAFESVTEE